MYTFVVIFARYLHLMLNAHAFFTVANMQRRRTRRLTALVLTQLRVGLVTTVMLTQVPLQSSPENGSGQDALLEEAPG